MTLVNLGVGVVLLVVTVGGIAFNSYILFFSCTRTSRQNRTATQLLLLHLGILNLLLAAVFLTTFFPALLDRTWLHEDSCEYIGSIWESLHIVAIWTVMALNVDKYITIASPLHYARFVTPFKAAVLLIVSWILAIIIVLPPLFVEGLSYYNRNAPGCALNIFESSFVVGNIYVGLTTFTGYILPILIVAITNGRILVIASHHRHRIVAALWDVTLSAQATVTPQKSHFYLNNYRGKSTITTFVHHVGSLLLMYLPTAVCRLYEASTRIKVHSSIILTAFVLLVASPTVNSFVYGVKSKVLRRVMVHILRKKLYKSEVTCEIQARTPSAPGSRRPSITPSIITLPLQKQFTRRMSEILTPTTPISLHNGNDPRFKLERQSSDLSWSKFKSYGDTTPKEGTPTSFHTPRMSPLTKFFPKFRNPQFSLDLPTPSWESTASQFLIGARHSSHSSTVSCNRQGSTETMTNGSVHNGGHRQSLRRALFARNKQKSLDLDTVHLEKEVRNLSNGPPRSISHQQMQDSQVSPSLIRPLILDSEPLSSTRKSKKVSWSSDSFSLSDRSNKNSPNDSEADTDRGPHIHIKKKRQRLTKQNGYKHSNKFTFEECESENAHGNHIVVKISVPTNGDDSDSETPRSNEFSLRFISTDINVVNNPLASHGTIAETVSTCYG